MNTELRRRSKSEASRSFFKLMNNSCFGKVSDRSVASRSKLTNPVLISHHPYLSVYGKCTGLHLDRLREVQIHFPTPSGPSELSLRHAAIGEHGVGEKHPHIDGAEQTGVCRLRHSRALQRKDDILLLSRAAPDLP